MVSTMTPRASILIVNYNGWPDIQRCLVSVLQAGHEDDEIIVIDNASFDDSAELISSHFPQVVLLRSEVNLGFGGANNWGARVAKGGYLAFLNPDTVVAPGWLDALIDGLEGSSHVGLATSKILLLNENATINTCGNDIHLSGLTLCRGMGKPASSMTRLEKVGAVSGAAFLITAALFETLDGYDEAFFLYMEDTDLSMRAALAGYDVVYVPDSVVYHDYALRFGPDKIYYQERNRYMMLLKIWRWPTLALLLPALVLAEIVAWGFVLLRDRKHWFNKVRAYGYLVRHWQEIMERRGRAQALRSVSDRELLHRLRFRLEFEQADGGIVSKGAHLVFDPLFYLLQRFLWIAVRW